MLLINIYLYSTRSQHQKEKNMNIILMLFVSILKFYRDATALLRISVLLIDGLHSFTYCLVFTLCYFAYKLVL